MGAISLCETVYTPDVRVSDLHSPTFHDVEHLKIRRTVPMADKEGITYLNAALQPPMNTKVRAAIDEYLDQAITNLNPKPIWQKIAMETKAQLAKHLNVPDSSVTFTRDTTEGLNLFQRSLKFNAGDNVVILDVEHPNQAYGWIGLANEGLEVRLIDTGREKFADADTFAPYVDERTIAIGVSSVMFHSGQMNDIRDICNRFRPKGVDVLVDLTQHVGTAVIDLDDWNVSAAAFSCHKAMGCPSGMAILYVNPNVLQSLKPTPPIVGAGAVSNLAPTLLANTDVQYHSTTARYGHLNMSLISAMALKASVQFIYEDMGIHKVEQHLRWLGQILVSHCQELGIAVIGSQDPHKRSSHVYVLDLMNPGWQDHFTREGIIVSHYRDGVRVSFGFYNNISDVDRLVKSLETGLSRGLPRE